MMTTKDFLDLQIKVFNLENKLKLISEWLLQKFADDPSLPDELGQKPVLLSATHSHQLQAQNTQLKEDQEHPRGIWTTIPGTGEDAVEQHEQQVQASRRRKPRKQLLRSKAIASSYEENSGIQVKEEINHIDNYNNNENSDVVEGIRIVDMSQIMNPDGSAPIISRTRQPYTCQTCHKKFRTQNMLNEHEMTHCFVQITALDSIRIQPFITEETESRQETEDEDDNDFTPADDCAESTDSDFELPLPVAKSKVETINNHVFTRKTRDTSASDKYKKNIRAKRNVGEFACSVCHKRFALARYVKQHFRLYHRDHNVSAHSCIFCEERFVSKPLLILHKKKQHSADYASELEARKRKSNKKKLDTENLTSEASDKNNVGRIRAQKNVGEFACSVCNQRFARKRYVNDHFRLHHRNQGHAAGVQSCHFCGEQFDTKYFLILHKKTDHVEEYAAELEASKALQISKQTKNDTEGLVKDKVRRVHKCLMCNDENVFSSKALLLKHESEAHGIDFRRHVARCDECNLAFVTTTGYRQHCQSVHLKLKPWLCPQCGETFTRKHHLNRHMDLHSDKKKYKCHLCQKSFQQNAGLGVHLKRHFKSQIQIQCTHCGQFYAGAQTLRQHINNVHLGIRSYPCSKCSSSFKSKGALAYHIKTHDNPNGRKRGLNKERLFVPKRPPHKLQVLPDTSYISDSNSAQLPITEDNSRSQSVAVNYQHRSEAAEIFDMQVLQSSVSISTDAQLNPYPAQLALTASVEEEAECVTDFQSWLL